MKPPVIYVVSCMFFAGTVTSMRSTKSLEGYPVGFLADCPGTTNEVIISKKSLKHLTFTVHGPGPAFSAKRTKYTYYQMKYLVKDPKFNLTKKTFLYVGGWLDSPGFPWGIVLAKHYTDLGYNVLMLDTNTFTTFDYPKAARYMRPVGRHVAEMLANLTKLGLNPKKLEVLGLSLGGQTISFIAKNYRMMTGMNISRLTALDPSGPCFRNLGPEDRLDQSDADFVDVVDTNIDGYGMAAPVGHVNFYVNGGEYQPGDIWWIPCDIVCSHIRSYFLWISSLQNPNSFLAVKCDSVQQARNKECFKNKPQVTNILGLNTDRTKKGIFYLATSNEFPYYLGEKGLTDESDVFQQRLKELNMKTEVLTM
ncbi:hypothetical protein O0L34_g16708 [Tuta absoluta]|nr:hypothetical protein O0L34_g16708 [Tuta absoluta]